MTSVFFKPISIFLTISSLFSLAVLGFSSIQTQAIFDPLLIESDKIGFSPAKSSPTKFGDADVILNIGGDARFTNAGSSATCSFKIKTFGAIDTDLVAGYPLTQSKLTAVNGGNYNATSGAFEVPYNTASGCAVRLARTAQNQPKWEFDIRVTRQSDSQIFGTRQAYFLLYGAIGQVSIGAS